MNTGVPAGTVLKQRHGNMVITTPGATYDALDIHGFVTISAPNVTIKRSIIRGGVATGGNVALVTDIDANAANFLLQDSDLVPEYPSVYIDGVKGGNYNLIRVNIHGTVDAAKIFGNAVTIKDSWLHDTTHYSSDPNQGGGPSHNDGIQILSGTAIRITHNTITGANNAALQVTQGNGPVSDLRFSGNWVDGGACSVNISNSPLAAISGIAVTDNRFGRATTVSNCPIILTRQSQLTIDGNVYDSSGRPVLLRYS